MFALPANTVAVDAPSSFERLEPLPKTAVELLHAISPSGSAGIDLEGVLADQPQLVTEVLRVSEESGAGDAWPEILRLLDQTAVARLAKSAITLLVRDYLRRALRVSEDYRYWRYMVACALCCEEVAVAIGQNTLLAYAAGLLHDTGRLALIAAYPIQYSNLLTLTDRKFAANEPFDILEYERLLFGLDHFGTGAWVAGAWRLPAWLCSTVGKFDEHASGEHAELVATVRAGTRLAHSLGFGYLAAAPRADIRTILADLPEAEKQWNASDSWEYTRNNMRAKIRSRMERYWHEE